MPQPAAIRVISANGMREVIADTRARFEAASGLGLDATVVETGAIRRRVLAGEPFDVVMVREAADDFERQGRLAPGSQVPLIRLRFGLAVRAGAPKPDVGTPEALKRALLAAKTVLITDPATGGIGGVHVMEVLTALGIAEAMQGRLVAGRGGDLHAARVVSGEADLAVQAEHEIKSVPGAAFLEFPEPFRREVVFTGGIGAASAKKAAARTYLAFLAGPQAASAIEAHHLARA